MACSVVTAFYPIRSKFPSSQYMQWAKTFLSLQSPIILFTEESLVETFQTMRGSKPIRILTIPFAELDTWKLYGPKWVEQHTMDPEKRIHTPELYAIWAQKPFFVEKAIRLNPFQTDFFFWCDIGAFRDPSISPIVLDSFPQTKYFQGDRLLLQAIHPLKGADTPMLDDGIYGPKLTHMWNENRLVGGLWGGSIDACLNWKAAYQKMIERYFEANRFAGKDQVLMFSVYLEHPELAVVVKCTVRGIDEWFFLEHLLSNKPVAYSLDESYCLQRAQRPIVSVNIMGGLGNQLFQVCAAYAYAKQMGGKLQIQHKTENGKRPLYFDSILSRFRDCIVGTVPSTLEVWKEQMPTKYSEIGPLRPQGKFLSGYLQSAKYFVNDTIKQDIQRLLAPDMVTLNNVKRKFAYLIKNSERVVVIHCRQTDYLAAAAYHGPLTGGYYKEAIQRVLQNVKNPIFLLCGDDASFWNTISSDISAIYDYEWLHMPPETDVDSFILLQQFQNYILSNSTFIWWVTWLADSKYVIAPSRWFGPSGPSEYEDIYEDSWIRI